jgi:hypothetical protein
LAGGSLTCQNGATCSPTNGNCICVIGFTGSTCGTCKSVLTSTFLITIMLNHLLSSIEDSGCNVGGVLACQNGATCLPNGNCSCPFGFTGLTCGTCTNYIFITLKLTR